MNELIYKGVLIHQWDEKLSLTDMWRAAGSDDVRRPSNWLASADAKNFIEALMVLNAGISGINDLVQTERGKLGGTRAHWQIGLAYAKYVSPDFHLWCNTVVRAVMEGKIPGPGGLTRADLLAMEARLEAKMDAKLSSAVEKLSFVAEAYDPTRQRVVTHRPTVRFLEGLRVPPKGRRGLTIKVSKLLLQLVVVSGDLSLVRMENEDKGRWMFHVDLFNRWHTNGGAEIIRAHKAEQEGQGVMKFALVPKKPRGPDPLDPK